MSYPLTSKLDNGATVSDWLGTAMTAASYAATRIAAIREGNTLTPVETLNDAIGQLEQALEEARKVQTHVAHVHAYSPREGVAAARVAWARNQTRENYPPKS